MGSKNPKYGGFSCESARVFYRRSASRAVQAKKILGSVGGSEPTVSTFFMQAAHSG